LHRSVIPGRLPAAAKRRRSQPAIGEAVGYTLYGETGSMIRARLLSINTDGRSRCFQSGDGVMNCHFASWDWSGVFLSIAAVAFCAVAAPPGAFAQSAENVAVVINDNSPDSQRIGAAYARARSLPESNVLHIHTSPDETVDRVIFVNTIEQPLAAAITRGGLQDRVLYLVLTKGVPIRVTGTKGANGTVASVDSELTLLYRKLAGSGVRPEGPVAIPYFLADREVSEARPFTHRDFDIFLVSRLDAYTVDEALGLIEKAGAAKGEGRIVLDQRDALINGVAETWLEAASKRLTEQGHGSQVVLETTPKPARNISQVLGYFSWGSTDPQNRVRTYGMSFVPGAIAANFVGSDARTFREPPPTWVPSGNTANRSTWYAGSPEALIGDLIRDGVTGASGYVEQPMLNGTIRPQVLFSAYYAGFNLIESFYLAMPYLSWQTVVIGDPLCAPLPHKALSRSEIDDGVDKTTELPSLFSKRRLAAATAQWPGISERAVALVLRADVLSARGDTRSARAAVEQALQVAPNFARALLMDASFDEQSGNRDKALETYRRILESEPNNVVALNNLAYGLAVHRNMPTEGMVFAKRAVVQAPTNPEVLDTLAWIQHLLGDNKTAAGTMAQVVRLNPLDPEARVRAAIVLAAAGALGVAREQVAAALKMNPALANNADVKRLQSQLAK